MWIIMPRFIYPTFVPIGTKVECESKMVLATNT